MAISVLNPTAIAMLRGRVAKSAEVVTEQLALFFDHPLPKRRAGSEEEYRKGVKAQADTPAHERPQVPGVGGSLFIDEEKNSVDEGEDGRVEVEAELGSGTF